MAQAKETDNSSNNKQLIKKRKKLLLSKEKEVMGKECSNYCLGVVTHPYIYPCIRMKVVGWGGGVCMVGQGKEVVTIVVYYCVRMGGCRTPFFPNTVCFPFGLHPALPHSSVPSPSSTYSFIHLSLHINMSPVSFCFHPSRACSSK